MKFCLKFYVLAALVILCTAFASATTLDLVSGSGSTNYVGYSATADGTPYVQFGSNNTPAACLVSRCQTYSVSPGTAWAAAGSAADGTTSTWESYDPNSGPLGNEANADENGFYTYTTNFQLTSTNWSGELSILADDTAAVYLNGIEILAPGMIGGDGHCADGTPNCLVAGTAYISSSDLLLGFNQLYFVVDQSGSSYQGVDYYGQMSTTPEPNTLLLLGTGLLGSAGALFRKMRVVAA
jgi:hypothetical protein